MRALLFAAYVYIAFLVLRAVLRWLLQREKKGAPPSGAAGEMVLDPQCKAYVLKERATARRAGGETLYFCGEACAAAYELERRP